MLVLILLISCFVLVTPLVVNNPAVLFSGSTAEKKSLMVNFVINQCPHNPTWGQISGPATICKKISGSDCTRHLTSYFDNYHKLVLIDTPGLSSEFSAQHITAYLNEMHHYLPSEVAHVLYFVSKEESKQILDHSTTKTTTTTECSSETDEECVPTEKAQIELEVIFSKLDELVAHFKSKSTYYVLKTTLLNFHLSEEDCVTFNEKIKKYFGNNEVHSICRFMDDSLIKSPNEIEAKTQILAGIKSIAADMKLLFQSTKILKLNEKKIMGDSIMTSGELHTLIQKFSTLQEEIIPRNSEKKSLSFETKELYNDAVLEHDELGRYMSFPPTCSENREKKFVSRECLFQKVVEVGKSLKPDFNCDYASTSLQTCLVEIQILILEELKFHHLSALIGQSLRVDQGVCRYCTPGIISYLVHLVYQHFISIITYLFFVLGIIYLLKRTLMR